MHGFKRGLAVASLGLASILYSGDGSDVPGFVPPPTNSKPLSPPPANISGGESFIPYPPPPAAPASRSEKKNPPVPPTIFTWAIGNQPDALATPRTLDNLLKVMKRDAGADYACEVKGMDEISGDPDKNPVVYISSHYNMDCTPDQKKTLREFVLRGGTLILNPGRGSTPFYDSAKRLAREIVPEGSITDFSPDHNIFHSYYDLEKVDAFLGEKGKKTIAPRVTGLTIDCRAAIIIPELGIDSCAEEVRKGEGEGREGVYDKVYTPEDAQKLGINILSYATSMRAWQENLKRQIVLQDKSNVSRAGSVNLAQIIYDGEWKTRHAGLPILLNQFNQASGVPVKYGYDEIRLSDKKLFDSPIIFMTGHEQFRLNDTERKNLRDYLSSGGMLIAEACCGRKAFDVSFREQINNLIPGESLTRVSVDSALYRMPNKIGQVAVTSALEKQIGSPTMNPELYQLNSEGKTVVLYSPKAMQGSWELSQSPYALGYKNALDLGVNMLLFGATR